MKYLSTRDLRNRPGYVRELGGEQDLVLTANGKPVAILVSVEDDDVDELAAAIRQARAQRAVSRMRRVAAERGIQEPDIDAEIQAVRERRAGS